MFTEVLIMIAPEFLSEPASLTPVFLLFRVSCCHLFSQNLPLVAAASSQSSPASPAHTPALPACDQHTRASASLPCWLCLVQMPASPSCRAPPPAKDGPCSPGQLLLPHLRAPTSPPPLSLPLPALPCLSECFQCSSRPASCHRGSKRGRIVVQLSKHWT